MEPPSKVCKQESDPDLGIPAYFSLLDDSSDDTNQLAELRWSKRWNDVVSEVRDVKSELLHVKNLLGVLARRERCAERKTEIAAGSLDRMDKEEDEVDDAQYEVYLQEALKSKTKVVKLVDMRFVDKGFGVGKAATRQTFCIHASVVQGPEVLTIGTSARAQVTQHARDLGWRSTCTRDICKLPKVEVRWTW